MRTHLALYSTFCPTSQSETSGEDFSPGAGRKQRRKGALGHSNLRGTGIK